VPLSTIVAIQFVPLLAISAIIATFTWRRTGSSVPGALICGIFVTWYVGRARHAGGVLARFRAKACPGRDPVGTGSREENASNEETEPRFWTTRTETLERKDGLKVPNALAFASALAVL